MSDWAVEGRQHLLNSKSTITLLRDKTAFAELLEQKGFGGQLPRAVGTIRDGVVEWDADAEVSTDGLIVKPRLGRRGRGVRLVSDREELSGVAGGYADALIQRRVINHAYASTVNPGSLNTIRVLAMRDPVTLEPFVGAAVHKFGSLATGCLDSFSQGGLSSLVDLDSGVLGPLVAIGDFGRVSHPTHPETSERVAGVEVPFWEECSSLVVDLMALLPDAVHIGWDMAITPTGPMVVEANGYPGLRLIQVHGPMTHPRAADFYLHYGLLRTPKRPPGGSGTVRPEAGHHEV